MYDSCFSEATTLKSTLQVVTGGGNPVPNYKCGLLRRVPAIIGDPLSSSIVSMSRVLGLWRIPQVSFCSLSNALDNTKESNEHNTNTYLKDKMLQIN